jgi:hypothetical protein
MDTLQIYSFLHNLCKNRDVSFDVIPCDGLETLKITKYPVLLVCNDQGHKEPGRHWTAFFITKKCIEFFCSYGMGINYYNSYFKNFVKNKIVLENKVQLQSEGTNVCGQYAIFFLYKRLKGCCRMSLYCNFSPDTRKNDRQVQKFVRINNHLLHSNCTKQNDKINQCCEDF